MLSIQEQLEIIRKGTADIISEDILVKKLKKSIETSTALNIKLGLDPSSPDIHLGHTVVLQKARDFQNLGHHVQLIIGDMTGRIGDPTGKNATRKQLTEEEVKENAKTYKEQVFKILDESKTTIHFNSEWFNKMNFSEVIKLASHATVAQMLERNDFANRFKENQSISLHEFFYPLMQGFDSVALKSDIELGGTDQTFNLLMGRGLQKYFNIEQQVAITMPILEGLDGVQKMSKSLNNYIGVKDSPEDMFGKIMSIRDEMIIRFFTLLTDKNLQEIEQIQQRLMNENPRDLKMELGEFIVERFHSKEKSLIAKMDFIQKFQKKIIPDNLHEIFIKNKELRAIDLIREIGFANSNREARQRIKEGALKINGEKFTNEFDIVTFENPVVVQLGKKFIKVITS